MKTNSWRTRAATDAAWKWIHRSGALFPPLFLCQDRSYSVDFKVFRALCALVCLKSSVTGSCWRQCCSYWGSPSQCPCTSWRVFPSRDAPPSAVRTAASSGSCRPPSGRCVLSISAGTWWSSTQCWGGRNSPGPGGWTLCPATSWCCRSSAEVHRQRW